MSSFSQTTIRFEFITRKNRKQLFFDNYNTSVPFVVIDEDNIIDSSKPILTTRDLMNVKAKLFSNKKDAVKYLNNQIKGVNEDD